MRDQKPPPYFTPRYFTPRYFIGLVLSPFLIFSLKLYSLQYTIDASQLLSGARAILAGDLYTILLLALSAHFLYRISFVTLQWISLLALVGLNLAYLVDSVLIAQYNVRLQLQGLFSLLGDAGIASAALLTPSTLLFIGIILLATFRISVRPWIVSTILLTVGALGAASTLLPNNVAVDRTYAANGLLSQLWPVSAQPDTFRYSDLEILAYQGQSTRRTKLGDFGAQQKKDSIILVIVESLSAVDSFKTSGVNDYLKRLDSLSTRGTLFTNFFSNYGNSIGGEVALISGHIPMAFPGSPPGLYEAFATLESIPHQLQRLGYHTEVLTSTSNDFVNRRAYVERVGFHRIDDRSFFDREFGAPHFAFDSPSDEVLYRETLKRVAALQRNERPFYFVVTTGSSHRPYVDPWQRGDTEANVWDYVDAQLEYLVQSLDSLHFFDTGILLITGDHVKMQPPSSAERARYAGTLDNRVVLLAIGRGVPQGKVDTRYFQQSDLISKLYSALRTDAPLSPEIIFVHNHWGRPFDPQSRPVFFIAEEAQQGAVKYEGRIIGNRTSWTFETPQSHRAIEAMLHGERALNQSEFRPFLQYCDPFRNAPALGKNIDSPVRNTEIALFRNAPHARGFPEISGAPFLTIQSEHYSIQELPTITSTERPYIATIQGQIKVSSDDLYWFRTVNGDVSCLYLDGKLIIEDPRLSRFQSFPQDGSTYLSSGVHTIEMVLRHETGLAETSLLYSRGDADHWRWTPLDASSTIP